MCSNPVRGANFSDIQSAIYLLCLHARKTGRDLRRVGIRVAFVTGEVLLPHQRQLIEATLNCSVANGYGGRDSGFIAHECPQGGMHLIADAVITEIVAADGRPAAVGEPGEIVVTDLYSHEAPFIRYATGDIGGLGQPMRVWAAPSVDRASRWAIQRFHRGRRRPDHQFAGTDLPGARSGGGRTVPYLPESSRSFSRSACA